MLRSCLAVYDNFLLIALHLKPHNLVLHLLELIGLERNQESGGNNIG